MRMWLCERKLSRSSRTGAVARDRRDDQRRCAGDPEHQCRLGLARDREDGGRRAGGRPRSRGRTPPGRTRAGCPVRSSRCPQTASATMIPPIPTAVTRAAASSPSANGAAISPAPATMSRPERRASGMSLRRVIAASRLRRESGRCVMWVTERARVLSAHLEAAARHAAGRAGALRDPLSRGGGGDGGRRARGRPPRPQAWRDGGRGRRRPGGRAARLRLAWRGEAGERARRLRARRERAHGARRGRLHGRLHGLPAAARCRVGRSRSTWPTASSTGPFGRTRAWWSWSAATPARSARSDLPYRPDLVVADVSFISLTKVLPAVLALRDRAVRLPRAREAPVRGWSRARREGRRGSLGGRPPGGARGGCRGPCEGRRAHR